MGVENERRGGGGSQFHLTSGEVDSAKPEVFASWTRVLNAMKQCRRRELNSAVNDFSLATSRYRIKLFILLLSSLFSILSVSYNICAGLPPRLPSQLNAFYVIDSRILAWSAIVLSS